MRIYHTDVCTTLSIESLAMHSSDSEKLLQAAARCAESLSLTSKKIVFAESCTSGLLAASLSRISGISEYLCGSFATYRNDSKVNWLGVSRSDLDDPQIGPVSETVALQMATGALSRTPEADLAVSITGHLGPGAPQELDGIAYSAIASRDGSTLIKQLLLDDSVAAESLLAANSLRETRQIAATLSVLAWVVAMNR